MRFLDPISGLIAAAIAVPLLLLLYFLRLRRKTLRVSSTLLWEQAFADLQVNVPFRWLRLSLLLVLQLLALAALIAALARPAIPGDAPLADRITLIIDHSASMSARDGPPDPDAGPDAPRPMRLDQARDRAITLIRELDRSAGASAAATRPSITVIASAASARIVQPATSFSADAIDAIRGIEPTDLPGGPEAALELLEATRTAQPERGEESADNPPPPREQIIIFTDNPAAPLNPTASPAAARVIRIGPPPGESASANLGIAALSIRRDDLKPDTIRAFVRVVTPSPQPLTSGLRVTLDGRVVASRSITARATAPANETFEFDSREGGVVLVSIDRTDVLDADNTAGGVIGPVSSPAILVVTPDAAATTPAPPDASPADPFLMGFLESLSPRRLRVVTLAMYQRELAAARAEQASRARTWPGFDLVIFDRVEPDAESVPDQPTISFGAGLPRPGLRLAPPASDATSRDTGAIRFDTWRRAHPLMRYVGLDNIIVSPPPPIVLNDNNAPVRAPTDQPAATSAPSPTLTITALASGPAGPIIVAAEEPGLADSAAAARPRHIVISFPLRRSNWATDTSFAVFMTNAVDTMLSAGAAADAWWFRTGEPLIARPQPGAATVNAEGPEVLTAAVDPSAPGPVTLGVPARTGLYRLSGAIDPVVCVNLLSEDESMLGRASSTDVVAATPSSAATPDAPSESASPTLTAPDQRRAYREIWHWFLLAAMALASVEWILFARASRA